MTGFYLYETGVDLWPLDALRPVSEISLGAFTLRERAERAVGSRSKAIVRQEIEAIARESGLDVVSPGPGIYLPANLLLRSAIPLEGPEEVGMAGERIVYLRLGRPRSASFDRMNPLKAAEGLPRREMTADFLDRPWDIVRLQEKVLAADCAELSKGPGSLDAAAIPHVSVDESHGRAFVDATARILPFTHLEGPLFIGPNALVKPHSYLRASSIGRACRVGGEISGTTFFSYSNKQHAGFIGNSVVGSWVNIGAGATGSNLKNTYGEVRVDGAGTGLQYFGQVIGDHSKIAIMTAMGTGSLYGICCNIFGGEIGFPAGPPKRIGDFAFGRERARIDAVLSTARTVMERRECELTGSMETLMRLRYRSLG